MVTFSELDANIEQNLTQKTTKVKKVEVFPPELFIPTRQPKNILIPSNIPSTISLSIKNLNNRPQNSFNRYKQINRMGMKFT